MTRVLAYVVDTVGVRGVEIAAEDRVEHRFGSSLDLLDDVDALRAELNTPALTARPRLRELERFADDWGRRLLPEAWLANPPDSCVLIPHAFLHEVPLHLVRTDSGEPLCVRSAVTMNSSLTSLRRALSRSSPDEAGLADPFWEIRRTESRRLLRDNPGGVDKADPPYQATGRRWLAAGVDVLGENDESWRSVPRQVLQAFDPRAAIPKPVTSDSVRSVLADRLVGQRYELVVLAAHGYRNPLDGRDSGLVVRASPTPLRRYTMPIDGQRNDERGVPYLFWDLPARDLPVELAPNTPAELLSVAELEAKRAYLECPLVILLGCSTGRPILYAGDQPQSLAELFLRLGAATVVAPMWDVRVPVVRDWATEFVRLLGGQTARGRAEAARRASQAMHERGAHLQDVGCLVVHGDYR